MKRSHFLGLVFALGLALAAPAAHGQDAQRSQEARTHYQRGTELFDELDYSGALAEFKRAYELSPNTMVLFNVAQCHFNLRHYAEALKFLQSYAREAGSSMPPGRKDTVEQELRELNGRVARVSIETVPPGATVSVDDAVVGTTPLPGPVALSVGRRRITATLADHTSATTSVELASGEGPPIVLTLEARSSSGRAPAPAGHEPQTESDSRRWLGYAALGVGVVGVGIGTGFGIAALDAESTLERTCPQKRCADNSSAHHQYDTMERNSTISTVGFVAGGLGIAGGLVLLFWPSHPNAEHASLRVAPTLGLGGGGVTGTF